LAILQQDAKAEAVEAAIVGNDGQPFDAHGYNLRDQILGNTAQTEAANDHGHVIGQTGQCLRVTGYDLVKASHMPPLCCYLSVWTFQTNAPSLAGRPYI